MIQQEESQVYCSLCAPPNYIYSKKQDYDFFLACKYQHFLCPKCYKQHQKCPFQHIKHQKLIEKSISMKAYKYSDSSLKIGKEIYHQFKQETRFQTEPLKKKPSKLAQTQRQIEQSIKLKKRLQMKLKWLQERRRAIYLAMAFVMDTILSLVQLTATVLQIYIMITSIFTNRFQVVSFAFYIAVFVFTVIITEAKYWFGSTRRLLWLIIVFLFYYMKLLFTNQIQRYKQHYNNHSKRKPLAFESVNYVLFLGKNIIFMIYLARYYNLLSSYVNRTALIFSILEIPSMIGSDISYSHPISYLINE